MQHWGDEFELFTLQPIVLYNLASLPGAYLGYNSSMTYNWRASLSDAWTVPAGLTFGRTLLLGNGDGLDLFLGGYPVVVRPLDNLRQSLLNFPSERSTGRCEVEVLIETASRAKTMIVRTTFSLDSVAYTWVRPGLHASEAAASSSRSSVTFPLK